MKLIIKKVISGGQTGADRAGLEAAKVTGIKTGGFCPKGYLTEKGSDKTLKEFGLIPTKTKDYTERTKLNIKHSDGTVIFSRNNKEGNAIGIGTILTVKIAKDFGKPFIINPNKEGFIDWVINNGIKVLNVAGNRKSQNKNIYNEVYLFLTENLWIPAVQTGIDTEEYKKFVNDITRMKKDLTSGSVTLLNKLVEALTKYTKNTKTHSSFVFNNIKRNLSGFEKDNTGYMFVLKNFADGFLNKFENVNKAKDEKKKYIDYLVNYKKQLADAGKKIIANALKEIKFNGKTVILFSNSSTIVSLFKRLTRRKILPDIIQCESEPEKEGVIQAKILRAMGFNVRVIKDYDIEKYLNKIDFGILGCDGYNDELFMNKRGTFNFVIRLNVKSKPVYVLSDSRKYRKGPFKFASLNDNSIFEQTPLKRITKMITEKSL